MAYFSNPLKNMKKAKAHKWMFYAALSKDNKVEKMFLRDHTKTWWEFDETMPLVTERTRSPLQANPDGLLGVIGPVVDFPRHLVPVEGKTALADAISACLFVSTSAIRGPNE